MKPREKQTDVLGRTLELSAPPERIVSLVPSLTETLFDLGAGARIVGVTDFCVFPEIPDAVARVGGTKNPDVDRVRELRPDLVYVNVEENLRRHAEAIEAFAPVFATEPDSVDGVRDLVRQLGRIHDRGEAAETWTGRLDRVIASLRETGDAFTFVCPIWKDPWMWCGGDTYVSDLVTIAGGMNLLGDRSRYPRIPMEEVLALEPDVVFLPDEPFEFEARDASALRGRTSARIVGPFPGHLFTWHGTRTVAGLEFLRETLRNDPGRGENVAPVTSGNCDDDQ